VGVERRLALVCGDPVVWNRRKKPRSPRSPCRPVSTAPPPASRRAGGAAGGGDRRRRAGAALVADARLPLISATGSTRMGRAVAPCCRRFARALLELGGNNA